MFDNCKIIDLTHSLFPQIPTWDGAAGFELNTVLDYEQCNSPVKFRVQKINCAAGAGTHMDAPSHCTPGASNIDDIAVNKFIMPGVVINVSQKADADYQISPQDILEFEQVHGRIAKDTLVIGYTGWEKYWHDPMRYRNPDASGLMHFPTFAHATMKLLLERNIAGIAIDTFSPDAFTSNFPIHRDLLAAQKIIIENIANVGYLPATGFYVVALPLKMQMATESPARVMAII